MQEIKYNLGNEMGNFTSSHKKDYGIEISENTRSILKLDGAGRMNALLQAVTEAGHEFGVMDKIHFDTAVMNDYFIIAFFENIITFQQAKRVKLEGSLIHASSLNAIIGVRENLFTIDDFIILRSPFYIKALVSDNGLHAMRNDLITMEEIKSLKNDLYFELLMSDAGIQALTEGKLTPESANAYRSYDELEAFLKTTYGYVNIGQIDIAAESLTTNRKPNNDPDKKTKFNTMLRYFEMQYSRDYKRIMHEFSFLKATSIDSKDEIQRFYKIHQEIEYYGLQDSYDHLLLLDVVLKQRKNIQADFEKDFPLGKAKIIRSDMVMMIDKTIAQWVQSGVISREEIDSRAVYTAEQLNHLLNQTYMPLQLLQHTLPALSDDEMQDTQAARQGVVERLLADSYPSFEDQKNDLLKLFSLRRHYLPGETLTQRMRDLKKETWQFFASITQAEDWKKPDVLARARQLFI